MAARSTPSIRPTILSYSKTTTIVSPLQSAVAVDRERVMRQQGQEHANTPLLAESLNNRFARLSRQLRSSDLPKGLTQERMSTLATIATAGSITVSALAELERVRPASMSRMISTLVADGLVRRDHNKNDRRTVLVSLTPRGRKEFEKARRFRLARLASALNSLPPEQLELLEDLAGALETLSEVLNGP